MLDQPLPQRSDGKQIQRERPADQLARVHEESDGAAHRLDPARLPESPTLEHLDSLPESGDPALGSGHPGAVALQTRGVGPALFMLPGAHWDPLSLLPLARHMGRERPVYALRDPRPAQPGGPSTIRELAAGCVDAMRALQPSGPYLLAGYCFGGIVAFEMARQLRAAGEKIALLALCDVPRADYPGFRRHWPLFLKEVFWWQTQRIIRPGRHPVPLRVSLETLLRHFRRRAGMLQPAPAPRAMAELSGAVRAYQPGMCSVPVAAILSCRHPQSGSPLDRRLGWRELVQGPWEVHRLPASHETMVREPDVAHLADRLRTLIASHLPSCSPCG